MKYSEFHRTVIWMWLRDILQRELDGYNRVPQSVDIGGFQLGEMVD